MKNISIISTILLATSMSFAIMAPHQMPMPPSQSPKVACDYAVNVKDDSGASVDYKNGEPITLSVSQGKIKAENATTAVLGFKMKLKMEQNCIQVGATTGIGGSKCNDLYKIQPTLTFEGGIYSTTELVAKKTDKNKIVSLTLNVGNREASVNCMVK